MSDLESLCASIRSREHAFWTTFIKSCLRRLLFQKSNANLESTITSTDFLMQLAMFSAGQPFLTLFCCACMTALPHCWTQNCSEAGLESLDIFSVGFTELILDSSMYLGVVHAVSRALVPVAFPGGAPPIPVRQGQPHRTVTLRGRACRIDHRAPG